MQPFGVQSLGSGIARGYLRPCGPPQHTTWPDKALQVPQAEGLIRV